MNIIEAYQKFHNNLRKNTDNNHDLSKYIDESLMDYSYEGVYDDDGNKNVSLFQKNIDCIVFYYTHIESNQRKDGTDVVSFEQYYDYWKPYNLQWVCNHLKK
jgi:hypothetical protein